MLPSCGRGHGAWFSVSFFMKGRRLFIAEGVDGVEAGGFPGGIPAEEDADDGADDESQNH